MKGCARPVGYVSIPRIREIMACYRVHQQLNILKYLPHESDLCET